MTNREFAEKDLVFQKACELAGIQPTKRQASKWSHRKGLARQFMKPAIEDIKRGQDEEEGKEKN